MSEKKIWVVVLVAFVLVSIGGLSFGLVGYNQDQNWQIIQSLNGTITVRDTAGVYARFFSTVWTYQRYMEFNYKLTSDSDDSIRVTFNDGGNAQIGCMIRIETPSGEEDRKRFHRQFAGSEKSIKNSVFSHLSNCVKATGPLMSASEHQSARKAEFAILVENQLRDGLYEMKQVEKELKDRTDTEGHPITVLATEFILNKTGQPTIAQVSPLTDKYQMTIIQFSATDTDYDDKILEQFEAKKESYLTAEKSKAQKEQAVQERLKLQEEGLRDKAQAEAVANVEKAKAVIAAEQKAEVALQVKIEAETKANQLLEVAKIEKTQAETTANKELQVATILAQAAEKKKLAIIAEAEGKQKAIELSGEITNLERATLDAEVKKAEVISQAIGQLQMPQVMFIGGNSGENGSDSIMQNMINLKLLESTGVLDRTKVDKSAVQAKRAAQPAPAPAQEPAKQ